MLTIYDIKYITLDTNPYYFDRKTMKFFGQTMKDFKVKKLDDKNYYIFAPTKCNSLSQRIFNLDSKELRTLTDAEKTEFKYKYH